MHKHSYKYYWTKQGEVSKKKFISSKIIINCLFLCLTIQPATNKNTDMFFPKTISKKIWFSLKKNILPIFISKYLHNLAKTNFNFHNFTNFTNFYQFEKLVSKYFHPYFIIIRIFPKFTKILKRLVDHFLFYSLIKVYLLE